MSDSDSDVIPAPQAVLGRRSSVPSLSQIAMEPREWVAPGPSGKVINDPIHGHMHFEADLMRYVDTPQFQRLRDLKQLGTTYLVYPGASHNRFEHSLGVAHLANTWMIQLKRLHGESMVTEEDRFLVALAGLVHDIGHGPFSHVFDNEFMPIARPGSDYDHETMSCKMFDWMVDHNSIDLSSQDCAIVKALVLGTGKCERHDIPGYLRDKMYLFDIVANGRNSVDVDKFDYIKRDSSSCSVHVSYDFERIWQSSKIIGDEICFHEKAVDDVYDLFHSRASLHKRIYSHRKAKAIEYMVTDVLLEANPVLKISDKTDRAEDFWTLTDFLLKEIEISTDEALTKARKMLQRIRCRDLYKHVCEFSVPASMVNGFRKVTAEDIVQNYGKSQTHSRVDLRVEDVIVHNLTIDYGLKDANRNACNPIDKCHFFRDWNDSEKIRIPREKVSTLLVPSCFCEKTVRAFCRSSDPEKIKAIVHGMEVTSRNLKCTSPRNTPSNRKRPRLSPGDAPDFSGHVLPTPPPFPFTGSQSSLG